MGYEVDTRPGQWVMEQTARRGRWIAAILAVFFLADGLITALVVGHRLTIGASAVLLAAALLSHRRIERFIDRHVRMRGGAWAEEAVGETLNQLRDEGWHVMHTVKPANGADLDHIVSGPNDLYLIETKDRWYPDAHLGRVKGQAKWLRHQVDCYVTPVICLHKRGGNPFHDRGVWVVPHQHLLEWLRKQHNQQVEFERLARFADSR